MADRLALAPVAPDGLGLGAPEILKADQLASRWP